MQTEVFLPPNGRVVIGSLRAGQDPPLRCMTEDVPFQKLPDKSEYDHMLMKTDNQKTHYIFRFYNKCWGQAMNLTPKL